jgi:hypothetical protein
MSKEYLQKLASDKNHIRHVTLKIVGDYLEAHANEIVEDAQDNLPVEEEEPDDDLMEMFYEPVVKGIEQLARELGQQAEGMVKGCVCYWGDDERVYPAVGELLKRLPLPFSSAFRREDDEGYRLVVSGELVFECLGPDDAIEATRQYVESRMFPAPPSDGEEQLN